MQCIVCGKTHARDSKYCSEKCAHKHIGQRRAMKRKEQGLCPKCGGPMDHPMRIGGPGAAEKKQKISYCSKCREDYRRRYEEKKAQKESAVPVASPRIVWFSRHPALPSQISELKRLFGDDVQIIPDPKPFSTADDVVERFKSQQADEMVIVTPLSVIGAICDRGIKPLWVEMEVVPVAEAEVTASGRGYRFIKFRRVKRLVLEFEEV